MNEREQALKTANNWLDNKMNTLVEMVPGDPDCDACVLARQFIRLSDRVDALEAALRHCQIVLGNMALENKGAVFNRWPINHEPLRNDARNLLPVIKAALAPEQDK
jgi:hypothetical protein